MTFAGQAQVPGYFFFGVYYSTINIEALSTKKQSNDRQEQDGAWFDYPLYSYYKPYGTAFALLGVQQRCRTNAK